MNEAKKEFKTAINFTQHLLIIMMFFSNSIGYTSKMPFNNKVSIIGYSNINRKTKIKINLKIYRLTLTSEVLNNFIFLSHLLTIFSSNYYTVIFAY